MKKEEYIECVLKHIQNKAFLNTIRQEIEDHISEREQYYLDIGYDEQTSQEKAVERMGDADELGLQMDILHDYKKHKIICIAGLILFAVNLMSVSLISELLYSDFIVHSSIIIALFTSYLVYRFAFASRCKAVLFLQGLASIAATIYFTKNLGIWIFDLVPSDQMQNSDFIYMFISFAVEIIFLINSVLCLTCSGEIKALIAGKPNTKILNRYKSYEYFLLIAAIIITILTFAFLVNTDSFVFLYTIR